MEDSPDGLMEDEDDKDYQLRVRISSTDKDALEKILALRGNSTISKLVREALALMEAARPSTVMEQKICDLATLLKREPKQVEDACILGIFDLIEGKAKVPLIVMEAHLYKSYKNLE